MRVIRFAALQVCLFFPPAQRSDNFLIDVPQDQDKMNVKYLFNIVLTINSPKTYCKHKSRIINRKQNSYMECTYINTEVHTCLNMGSFLIYTTIYFYPFLIFNYWLHNLLLALLVTMFFISFINAYNFNLFNLHLLQFMLWLVIYLEFP